MYARSSNPEWQNSRDADTSFERYEAALQDEGDEVFDIRKLINAVWRGKWTIALFAGLGALAALIVVSWMEPRYTATSSILFEPERLQVLDFTQLLAEQGAQVNLGDQIEILGSNMLLTRVVDQLDLDAPPPELDAVSDATNLAGEATQDVRSSKLPMLATELLERLGLHRAEVQGEPEPVDPEELQTKRTRDAVSWLRRNLKLSQVPGARVIEVSFTADMPAQAALVSNTISNQYIAVQNDAAKEEVSAVIDALNQRIEELKQRLDRAEKAVADARLELSEREVQSSEMTSLQLNTLNTALAQLRLERAEAEGRYERAASALAEERDLWVVTEFRESQFISSFRSQEIEILGGMAEDKAIAGEARTPAKVVADARLEEIRRNIRQEASYVVEALEFEANSLRQRETQLEEMIRELEVTRINQAADELRIDRLERDAVATRNLYESFADRVKEVSEQAKLPASGGKILSFAEPPGSPNRDAGRSLIIVATAAAALLGLGLVLLRERLNNSFRSPNELSEATGLRVLAAIPQVGRKKSTRKLVASFLANPRSLLAESVRNLRTSVLFADPAKTPRVVMITSSVPNEAKTSISLLMGITSQQMGRTAVLVPCDFRDRSNVRMYSAFKMLDEESPRRGIVSVLTGTASLKEALLVEPKSGLHILALSPEEQIKGSPSDLLASDEFVNLIRQLREKYELVVLDTPPALAVTDARLLARVADSIVYLVRWNSTSKNAVKEGLKELASMKVPITGTVFTSVKQSVAAKYADNEFFYKQSYGGYYK
jgi:uncharacterized protein involved in exopolysaccharide biosynthesis/Mrp family chromosome partitioning ATPase